MMPEVMKGDRMEPFASCISQAWRYSALIWSAYESIGVEINPIKQLKEMINL